MKIIVVLITLCILNDKLVTASFRITGFIVNEDEDLPINKGNQKTKKENILTPSVQGTSTLRTGEELGQESLGFTPKSHDTVAKRLHIAPTINLIQTLKTLDNIGPSVKRSQEQKVATKAKSSHEVGKIESNNTVTAKSSLAKSNHTGHEQVNVSGHDSLQSTNEAPKTVSKKYAQPNMITDSKLKGFLGKDANHTFSSVGKPEKTQKRSEEKILKFSQSNISAQDTNNSTKSPFSPIVSMSNHSSEAKVYSAEPTVDQHFHLNTTLKNQSSLKKQFIKTPKLHLIDTGEFLGFKNHDAVKNVTSRFILPTLKKDKIEVECDEDKKCPKNKYCRHFVCIECHRKHHECMEDDQCCDDMPCVYGRCDDKPKGSPGTICEKDGDCGEGCCVLEPTISRDHGICKVKLKEFHQCAPVLFRKVWTGEEKPKCGPCEGGLECVEKGVEASHLVCMKKKS